MIKFYGYKKCGTSRKGEKFFTDNNLEYKFIDITENPPSRTELVKIIKFSGEELKKFYNTSGQAYKEGKIKDKLKTLGEKEQIDLLAGNGRLLKRPLITDGKAATVGFNEDRFKSTWL